MHVTCKCLRKQTRAMLSEEVLLLRSAPAMATQRQTAIQSRCSHLSTTFQGSNASQTRITCVSCRQTMLLIYHHLPDTLVEQALQRRARARGEPMSVSVSQPQDPGISRQSRIHAGATGSAAAAPKPEFEGVDNQSDDQSLSEQVPKAHIQVAIQVATHPTPVTHPQSKQTQHTKQQHN